jgi:hypothetical protein
MAEEPNNNDNNNNSYYFQTDTRSRPSSKLALSSGTSI